MCFVIVRFHPVAGELSNSEQGHVLYKPRILCSAFSDKICWSLETVHFRVLISGLGHTCLDSQSSFILAVSIEVFLDEINIEIDRLTKLLPPAGWASPTQVNAQIEAQEWPLLNKSEFSSRCPWGPQAVSAPQVFRLQGGLLSFHVCVSQSLRQVSHWFRLSRRLYSQPVVHGNTGEVWTPPWGCHKGSPIARRVAQGAGGWDSAILQDRTHHGLGSGHGRAPGCPPRTAGPPSGPAPPSLWD